MEHCTTSCMGVLPPAQSKFGEQRYIYNVWGRLLMKQVQSAQKSGAKEHATLEMVLRSTLAWPCMVVYHVSFENAASEDTTENGAGATEHTTS